MVYISSEDLESMAMGNSKDAPSEFVEAIPCSRNAAILNPEEEREREREIVGIFCSLFFGERERERLMCVFFCVYLRSVCVFGRKDGHETWDMGHET